MRSRRPQLADLRGAQRAAFALLGRGPAGIPHEVVSVSCRRPSNAWSRVSGLWGPISARLASTSTVGSRRRAAAIASPARVCAFSWIRSASSSAWKVARLTAAGRLRALVAWGPSSSPGQTRLRSAISETIHFGDCVAAVVLDASHIRDVSSRHGSAGS
jgi:hypothetical protein